MSAKRSDGTRTTDDDPAAFPSALPRQTATSDAAPIPQPPPLQPPLAVRAPEAARLLGISERALWTLTRSGEVPHVKVGRATIYAVDQLRTWLADHAKKSTRRSANRAGKEAAG